MYVGRSIELQISHQHIIYPAMRACACAMQTSKRSSAPFFFLPTPPSSLADSHPARATMTFKSPIPAIYLTSYLTLPPVPAMGSYILHMRPSIVGHGRPIATPSVRVASNLSGEKDTRVRSR